MRKILNIAYGFIEPTGSGAIYRHHRQQIRDGTAVEVSRTYRRLKDN